MTTIIDPFTGRDITEKVRALTERLLEVNRAYHASKDPACATWERYSIPAFDPVSNRRGRMDGIGCERHGVFLSWAADEPMPS
jgi:hypothetical protein